MYREIRYSKDGARLGYKGQIYPVKFISHTRRRRKTKIHLSLHFFGNYMTYGQTMCGCNGELEVLPHAWRVTQDELAAMATCRNCLRSYNKMKRAGEILE